MVRELVFIKKKRIIKKNNAMSPSPFPTRRIISEKKSADGSAYPRTRRASGRASGLFRRIEVSRDITRIFFFISLINYRPY